MNREVTRSPKDIRKRLEEERTEALDNLEQPGIENPAAAYWGGRYYVAVNMLLWMGPYSGRVFGKSERYGSGSDQ